MTAAHSKCRASAGCSRRYGRGSCSCLLTPSPFRVLLPQDARCPAAACNIKNKLLDLFEQACICAVSCVASRAAFLCITLLAHRCSHCSCIELIALRTARAYHCSRIALLAHVTARASHSSLIALLARHVRQRPLPCAWVRGVVLAATCRWALRHARGSCAWPPRISRQDL